MTAIKNRVVKGYVVRAKVNGRLAQISRRYHVYAAAVEFAELARKTSEGVEIKEVMGKEK